MLPFTDDINKTIGNAEWVQTNRGLQSMETTCKTEIMHLAFLKHGRRVLIWGLARCLVDYKDMPEFLYPMSPFYRPVEVG